jgi:hypothetical protein
MPRFLLLFERRAATMSRLGRLSSPSCPLVTVNSQMRSSRTVRNHGFHLILRPTAGAEGQET